VRGGEGCASVLEGAHLKKRFESEARQHQESSR